VGKEWDAIPNFDDEFAKISESVHHTGHKKIEVLYGGRDANGNPQYPTEGDGHGHWIALEKDGVYEMLFWRYPEYEGGHYEQGTKKSNPLTEIEREVRTENEHQREMPYTAIPSASSLSTADLAVRIQQIKQVAKEQITLAKNTTNNLYTSQRQILSLIKPSRSGDEVALGLANAEKALNDFVLCLNQLSDACDMFIRNLEE
jgi:hypothetical protein